MTSYGAGEDEMSQRRRVAAQAFVARRGELGMTQEEVASAAGVVVRTVQNFEAGRWPNPRTRALLEKALGWPGGEIARLAGPPRPYLDPQLMDRVSQLTIAELRALRERIGELEQQMGRRHDDERAGRGTGTTAAAG